MKRSLGMICGAVALAGLGWMVARAAVPASAQADRGLSPIPPEIAARLPRFCRFDVDLSSVANPHAVVLAQTELGDFTCPFVAGGAEPVRIYKSKGNQPCGPAALAGMKVVATRQLDSRTARLETQCVEDPIVDRDLPPALKGGKAYLLRYDESHASFKERSRFEFGLDDSRTGAPFVAIASGDQYPSNDYTRPIAFRCVQMPPGVSMDALGFYREAGRPLPTSVTEEDVTGQDCGQVIRNRVGPMGSTSGRAMPRDTPDGVYQSGEFELLLLSAEHSLSGRAAVHRVRAILARDGYQAAQGRGHPTFVYGTAIVSRAKDGSVMALTAGPAEQVVEMREITDRNCRAAFDIASELRLDILASSTMGGRSRFTSRRSMVKWRQLGRRGSFPPPTQPTSAPYCVPDSRNGGMARHVSQSI